MLSRSLVIYSCYFAQFLKARLAYKADFIASIAANILVTLSGLLFVIFLMDGQVVQSLKGWSREEVLFIYGYSMIAMAFFSAIAYNLYRFGDRYVIQGQFDRVLLRPLNSLCQVLFESFNLESIGSLVAGMLVLYYSAGRLSISFSAVDYAWLLISGISGGIILLSVFIFVASLSFHFEDRLGVAAPVYNLISFGRYPISIFNTVIQFVLRWIIPFAFIAFYPATHFFEHQGFSFFCYFTPVMAVITLLIAGLAWRFGVSRYASTGS